MFLTELVLWDLPRPDFWALGAELVWKGPKDHFVVPKGFETDLASIPVALRSLLDRNGVSRRPAALHDWCYHSHCLPRRKADNLLRRALISEGETRFRAWVYGAGVRLGGASAYNVHPRGCTAQDFMTKALYVAALNAGLIPHV